MEVSVDGLGTWSLNLTSPISASLGSVDKCKVMDSKMKPLWLVFENQDAIGDGIYQIFKNGDGKPGEEGSMYMYGDGDEVTVMMVMMVMVMMVMVMVVMMMRVMVMMVMVMRV